MCARLLMCPLCSQPGFLTLDSLRTGLISVATRPLTCPVCNDLLLGIDKLTIHLFSHTINLNGNSTIESPIHTTIVTTTNNNLPTVHNLQNSDLQTTFLNTFSENNLNIQNSLQSSKNLQTTKDIKASISNSRICIQDQNVSLNNTVQVTCLSNLSCGNEKVDIIHDICENNEIMQKLEKDSLHTLQGTTKLNYTTQYYSNDVKHVNLMQHQVQGEHGNIQAFKSWIQDQHCEQQTSIKENASKLKSSMDNEKPCSNKQNYSEEMTRNEFPNNTTICANGSLERLSSKKDTHDNSLPICNETQNQTHQEDQEQHVIQHLKTHEAKQWECDVCSKMFTTKYFLKKHKRLHSGEMPYKCNICNKTFTFQQSYHKHRLYHKDDKPHTCATCGRSFKELSTLHNHERIHTGEKPFACETCDTAYKKKPQLITVQAQIGKVLTLCNIRKCFRQRVSYLVHRRIHTGVMPYKCTACGKSFRYKVSQRTHKCPAQQMGNIQQTSNIDQQQIKLSNTQDTGNDLCKTQKDSLEENQPVLNVINNEENKYVLIINDQGQHLLTKESHIEKIQAIPNKEEKLEEFVRINNNSQREKNIWKSNIPNSSVSKNLPEVTKTVCTKDERSLVEDASDFFSMIISPLENGLSSPTTKMEHLRVSSPTQKEDTLKSYNNFRSTTHMDMNIITTSIEQPLSGQDNITNSLQTINEESLKQLLYDMEEK
ncbi:uncharacterized protein LOC143178772 isoform X4 [Calliopsis andreniformis]|uniref:uncharacterized protein LOC143178772 isoform X4 n=1 Tax=Calliopsis andreniformis TaxID=337506 RepID=UPI003FCDEBF9